MNTRRQLQLFEMGRRMDDEGRALEHYIEATPTGELRNKLTEANIHRMAMQKALQEARALDT